MVSKSFFKILLFILILQISFEGFGQLSKTHYIPPLTYANNSNSTPQDQYIYISTPSGANVPYKIIPVGQPVTNYITGVLSNNNPVVYSIGTGNSQLFIPSIQTSTITNNKGYIIEAEAPVYVSIRINAGAQAEAMVSKGLSALGNTFRVGTYTNEKPASDYLTFVSVMATENNTQVTISDLPAGLIIENYTGVIPVIVTLNEGESYTVAINSNNGNINKDGLIGSLVSASKPIVVNCGATNGSFGNGNGRDYGIDQIVDASKVGTEYIFVRGSGNNEWENVLIVANTNNTSISINGNTSIATINAGDYYVIEGDQYNSNGNMYVKTSQPVFAYQGIGGLGTNGTPNEANQGMFFVPPLSCEARGNLNNIPLIDNIGSLTYLGGVTIVTKAGATITINNLPLSNFTTVGPSAVTGKTDYVTYKVSGLTGNISVQSSDELYCAYFNYNGSAASGSFYSGFPSAPEINFNPQFATLGNCIPNITLSAANAQIFDSFEWWFDDGTGFKNLFVNTSSYTPTIPGKYKLIGIITCTLERLESIEIPISICPDDIDNDGIIDNLDIDNDNDGILNCTESRGDVILDLSNIRPPYLNFVDGTINTTLAANNITASPSNSINLTSTGTFTSNVAPSGSGENIYDITFNEPINIKLYENTSVVHTSVNGEFFIAKILPVNKNITLVDPDNRLLVDSNFDGVFETGIKQISGSEIRFKINPTPSGNTPYAFYGNKVEAFSFVHKLNNTTQSSSFSATIGLTCFKKDTDLDGIEDALDLDNDNDGIPDFIENTGTLVTLSGIDADKNGLDDIYSLTTPLDSDKDGVPNFYDLDSDNDGIYDLIETGQLGLLTDADLNGVIDNGATFGINGWIDTTETAPDSNLIGYTLNNLDADGLFSFIDLDSDGDACSDVIEAGFSDANGDNLLGDNVVTTGLTGKVTNAANGYTIPNSNYLNFAPILIATQPINTPVCETTNTTIFVVSAEADTYQWETSIDGINWNTINDDATYSGTQTANLTISNTPITFNNFYYRVKLDRNGNSCGIYSNAMRLTVYTLPIANNPNPYLQCDDASNDGQAFFNLELNTIKEEINPNYIAEGLTFSFYKDQTATNPILNPISYQDGLGFLSETVWIRVENPNGCFRVVPLTLAVSPSSTALSSYKPTSLYQCDDGLNNRDGVSTFNMSNISNYISTTIFSTFNVTVDFYETQIDAELETNKILDIANHQNTKFPNNQSIWVRVKSDLGNNCLGLQEFPNLLIVEALPTAYPVPDQIGCNDGSKLINGLYPFDTSQIESTLLNGQLLSNVSVTYTYLDIDGVTILNTSKLPNPLLTKQSQTITARVTNINSNDPDGACFDVTTINFKIEIPPFANLVAPQIVCDGDSGDVDDDGLFPFNTSTFKKTVLGRFQPLMEVYFDYIDEDGNPVKKSPTLPNPLISKSQRINVEVINPLNTNCSTTTSINLVVNPLPDFTVISPQIVCTSDPNFTIELDPQESSVIDTYAYKWFFEGNEIATSSTLEVSTPGTYTVTLTKTDGTKCSRTRDIVVNASEKATLTQNDVTIIDLNENNSVTINTTNIGSGTYEFALREVGSSFINYQTEPVFNNVKPGFYTIYVRDVICGETTLNISVIGHLKFFTPNGDGFNDYWQLGGINNTIQPNSIIYVYDRYGKLLKQLTPSSPGWDGTYNGNALPTGDYWFKVFLQDGRQYNGHFTLKR